MRSDRGYTLIEVLLGVLLMSLMLALAVPSLWEFQRSAVRVGIERQLMADLQRLRADAGARGTRGVLIIAADGRSYAFGLDWIPFNTPPTTDDGPVERRMPDGISIEPESTLIFDSRGYLIDFDGRSASAALTLSDEGYGFAAGTVMPTGAVEFD